MKLIFTKDDRNEIDVTLQKGTIIEEFTYTEMVRQLLLSNDFKDTEYINLSQDEKQRLEDMLNKITMIFRDE